MPLLEATLNILPNAAKCCGSYYYECPARQMPPVQSDQIFLSDNIRGSTAYDILNTQESHLGRFY